MVPGMDTETPAATVTSTQTTEPGSMPSTPSHSPASSERRKRRPPAPPAGAPDRQLVERIVRIIQCDHQTRELLVGIARPRSDSDVDLVIASMEAASQISKAATWVIEAAADDPMALGVRATDLAISGDLVNDVVAILRQLGALSSARQSTSAAKIGLQIARSVASLEPSITRRLKSLVATIA
jgi:hypothetical protein